MAEPTQDMHDWVAELLALSGQAAGAAPGGPQPDGASAGANGAPAVRLGPLAGAPGGMGGIGNPAVRLSEPPAPPLVQLGQAGTVAQPQGVRLASAAPTAPTGPVSVHLGPIVPLDKGASRTNALLAAGDRDAAAAVQAQRDAEVQEEAERRQDAADRVAQAESEKRAGITSCPKNELGPMPQESSDIEHFGAGLRHGASRLDNALDRTGIAVTNWVDARVPLLDQLDRAVGSTPETRAAHLAQLDAEEAQYQDRHGNSRAARIGDVTGEAAVAGVATLATGGAALPEVAAGRFALGRAGQAATSFLGQSGRTLAVNAGVGCVSGGVSGQLSDGWRGAAVGCTVGMGTNVLAPGLANGSTGLAARLGAGPVGQAVTAGATYTAVNAAGGGVSQIGANYAMSRNLWENVPRATLLGGVMPLASGDAFFSATSAAASRTAVGGVGRLTVPELGGYAVSAQTGVFGIGATIGTNAYDTRPASAPAATLPTQSGARPMQEGDNGMPFIAFGGT